MGKYLMIIGVVMILAGLLWLAGERLGLGRLPGDIVIERENFRLYLPIASSIVISLVISALFWLFSRW